MASWLLYSIIYNANAATFRLLSVSTQCNKTTINHMAEHLIRSVYSGALHTRVLFPNLYFYPNRYLYVNFINSYFCVYLRTARKVNAVQGEVMHLQADLQIA